MKKLLTFMCAVILLSMSSAYASFTVVEDAETEDAGGIAAAQEDQVMYSDILDAEKFWVRVSAKADERSQKLKFDEDGGFYPVLVADLDGTVNGTRAKVGNLGNRKAQDAFLADSSMLLLYMKFIGNEQEITVGGQKFVMLSGDIVRFAIELPQGKNIRKLTETEKQCLNPIKAFDNFTFVNDESSITFGHYRYAWQSLLGTAEECAGEWALKKRK